MLPSGKFFRKIIAISPDLVYTGRCIGHSSLRRKQVSSLLYSRIRRQAGGEGKIASPPVFCCFSILPVFVFSALSLLRIFALTALLSFRYLRFRHRCRTGFCTSPASLIGPIFPRFRLCHRHGSRLFPALLSSRLLLLSVPIICRYFLFFGIDSSPVPGSFFSAGIPFLDFKGGCFYPFGFCAVVFSACIRRFCPVTAPFSDLGASRFLSSFCPALDTFLSSRRWCLPY